MSLLTRGLAAAGLCLAGTVLLAPSAHAGPGLTGKQLVGAASASSTATTKTVQAACPAGKVPIGGGGFVNGPSTVKITMTRPQPTGSYWEVAAVATSGKPTWSLAAYAICVNRPDGLLYVTEDSVSQPSEVRSALAGCPGGRRALGVGARAAAEPGRNVTLGYVFPAADGAGAFAASHSAQGGEPQNWTTRAYAVCANAVTTTPTTHSTLSSSSDRDQSVNCPPGRLTSVGGFIDQNGNGEVGFTGLYPDASMSRATVLAHEDADGTTASWTLGVWAICA